MEEDNIKAKTAFDAAIQTHHLEIIKAAIPYINTSEQKVISVFVKAAELAETINIFQKPEASIGICSLGNNSGTILDMLNDVKTVCNTKEQDIINMIINYYNAFQMYNTYRQSYDDNDNMEHPNSSTLYNNLKDLLTPEQQQMFETYSLMFNS
ncbi:hypothetical protein C8E03_11613 [Lachnotalea glycerini]|uniref:Uncharacterized protein n=1 Tax=Lachnotalea glycerini TaxID=1763509 RepID=A0A255IM98_9FIRM|nr:hypothetical protein [Lachnotalea glycerini]PXV85582.1 hypothetical protein C8E03_11613 [Lachnotalea glycerini]RDY31119.1 hypothetical protein CG710_011050 [Lachnotalea glycerini]